MKDISKSGQNMSQRHAKCLENAILKTRNPLFQDDTMHGTASFLAPFWMWDGHIFLLAKLRCTNGVYSVANTDDGIKVVELRHVVFPVRGSCRDFLGN